jgi:hypothetical protein
MRRGISTFEGARARFMLSRADVVRATITPLEAGFCHVTLAAGGVRGAARGGRRCGGAGRDRVGSCGCAHGAQRVLGDPLLPAVGAAGWRGSSPAASNPSPIEPSSGWSARSTTWKETRASRPMSFPGADLA